MTTSPDDPAADFAPHDELPPRAAESPQPMIRLDQFLKLTGLFATGGQAKLAIQGGEVLVNGAVETRRRKQLHPGDVVVWDGEEFEVGAG